MLYSDNDVFYTVLQFARRDFLRYMWAFWRGKEEFERIAWAISSFTFVVRCHVTWYNRIWSVWPICVLRDVSAKKTSFSSSSLKTGPIMLNYKVLLPSLCLELMKEDYFISISAEDQWIIAWPGSLNLAWHRRNRALWWAISVTYLWALRELLSMAG